MTAEIEKLILNFELAPINGIKKKKKKIPHGNVQIKKMV